MRPTVPQGARVIKAAERPQSGYPQAQPMRAVLCFEKAHGFGDWRIIIGTGATRKLRKLANDDRKKCVIVVKKIKYVLDIV